VRLGIGKRVQELGFTQVEPTMFRKEDGDLKLRVDCVKADEKISKLVERQLRRFRILYAEAQGIRDFGTRLP
jgi:hypothetical protein